MNNITGDVSDLLIKLNFLSEIKSGYKINVCNSSFIKPQNWFGPILRGYHQENRKTTLGYIKDIVNRLSEVITNHDEREIIEKIKEILPHSINGLQRLNDTYYNDPDMISNLKVCISTMEMQYKRLSNFV
jgi:hypothetical protein